MNLVRKLIELDRASPKRIAIVGDCMVDKYVHGHMEPSQDGCDKFIVESQVSVPGGAENAERSLSHWNSAKLVYGLIEPETTKTRFICGDKIVFRRDDEAVWLDRTKAFAQGLRQDLIEAIRDANLFDAVLLSDYDKGLLTPEFIRQVADLCRERGVPCVADAKREPSVYEGCILKCNADYNQRFPIGGVGVRSAIITRGDETPFIFDGYIANEIMKTRDDDGQVHRWRPAPVTCKNHVGAGDCFSAHLVLALAHGFSLEDAAAIAHSAGRVYVQHPHNRPPLPEEIAADFGA